MGTEIGSNYRDSSKMVS